MSLKVRPAKAPYLSGKKDYKEMMESETKIEALQRKSYKFSQFNKPYAHRFDYPSTENIYPDALTVGGYYNPQIGRLQNLKNDLKITEQKGENECVGCVVDLTEFLIRCNCNNEPFPSKIEFCIISDVKEPEVTFFSPYIKKLYKTSHLKLPGNECVRRCYEAELGDCEAVEAELCKEGFFGAEVKKVIAVACGRSIYGNYVRDSECSQCNSSITISGSDTTVKSSTQQYTATNCYQNSPCESSASVVWSVSGTGATISQTGLLTTNATACGTLTITASCLNCGTSDTHEVKVTDGGQWVIISTCGFNPAVCYNFFCRSCITINGNIRTVINVFTVCKSFVAGECDGSPGNSPDCVTSCGGGCACVGGNCTGINSCDIHPISYTKVISEWVC